MKQAERFHTAGRILAALLMLLVVAPALNAQYMRHTLFTRADRKVTAKTLGLATDASLMSIQLDSRAFRSISGPILRVDNLPLDRHTTVDLDLEEHNIIAPDAVLISTDENGPAPLPKLSTRIFKGTVTGDPSSHVYLAMSDNSVHGNVVVDGRSYEIATDLSAPRTDTRVAAAVFQSADVKGTSLTCGLRDEHIHPKFSDKEMARLSDPHLMSANGEILYSVHGAFDADYEYWYTRFNSDEKLAAEYMLEMVGRVSDIYEADLGCQIVIGWMNIWKVPNDPYNDATFMPIAVEEARIYWAGRNDVERGFNMTFSGKAWEPLGIAGIVSEIDVLCSRQMSNSYMVVTRADRTQDFLVLAHELGHLFGAYHTHNCTWSPFIDQCAAAEMGNCFPPSEVHDTIGTVMSYCGKKMPTFGPRPSTFLKNRLAQRFAQSNSCVKPSRKLTTVPNVILMPGAKIGKPVDTTIKNYFRNDSKDNITVEAFDLTGINIAEIEITSPTFPFTLAAGERKDLTLHYKATTDQPSQGVMKLTHTAYNKGNQLVIQAYAFEDQALLDFRGDANGDVNFGERMVGEKADTLIGDLFVNLGNIDLLVDKTDIVGPDMLDFKIADGSAPFVLQPLGTGVARLKFEPTKPGTKRAWLRVESNSKNGPDSIELKGSAIQAPILQLPVRDLLIDFGPRERGTQFDTSFANFFFNSGGLPLSIETGVNGDNANVFIYNGALEELEPGQGLDLNVSFFAAPNEPDGWKQAFLVIYTNTAKERDTVRLLARIGNTSAVPADVDAVTGFTVAPNPTSGDALVTIAPLADEIGRTYTLSVTDASGREVAAQTGRVSKDGVSYTVKGATLPSGIYHVRITTDKGSRARAVTVAR